MRKCNRTVCQNVDSTYWNSSTRAYYCKQCAHKINKMNPEHLRDHGEQLCIEDQTRKSVFEGLKDLKAGRTTPFDPNTEDL